MNKKPENSPSHRILIVDDQPKNLQVLGITLKKRNIKSVIAINGEQALQIAESNRPDLILLDIAMPGMDGFETCRRLKNNAKTADIPVIFLTARNQSNDIIKGFDVGAVDYVTKPFNSSELLQRVFIHLELKTSRDIIKKQNQELREFNQTLDNANLLLDRQNQELKQLNATKDRMFSIIAHDLRGPVGSFKSIIDLMLEMPDEFEGDRMIETLTMMRESAGQTFNLLENLLYWSRSQRDEIVVNQQNFNLSDVIFETISLLSINADNKKIRLQMKIEPNLQTYADKNMITTVIRNLLNNAIKFTPENGLITVWARRKQNEIQIKVRDTGVGISETKLNELFDSSLLFSTEGTNQEKGSGLGLILCKEFLEKNGGTIHVESVVNEGSTFSFNLPLAVQNQEV